MEHLAGRPSLDKDFVTALMQILSNDRKPLNKPLPLGGRHFDRAGRRDHLHRLCHTLVTESQSLRINFSSGTLIIFNHPAEMKARVINMTSTSSMWGSLHFLSSPLTTLTDEFHKGVGVAIWHAKNRTARLSEPLRAWFQQY